MSTLTDQLDAVKQSVLELEQQVVGTSPLSAQLAQQQNDIHTYAQQLQVETVVIEERSKALDVRESDITTREQKLQLAKDEFKAQVSANAKEVAAE